MFKSRKGISPILATLLLIVIAVAAIIVTYAWVMTYMGTQTQQAGALLSWESVRWYGSPTDAALNRTDIVVLNIGTSTVKIVRVYLGTTADNPVEVTSRCTGDINATISTQKTATITIEWPTVIGSQWNHGQTYYLTIATEPGNALKFSYHVQ
jgi:flagellin-like protein